MVDPVNMLTKRARMKRPCMLLDVNVVVNATIKPCHLDIRGLEGGLIISYVVGCLYITLRSKNITEFPLISFYNVKFNS